MHQSPLIRIRPGRDEDGLALIALIERCWADYPGCIMDVDAEAPELRALATYYARRGGALWVAGDAEGMIATKPEGEGAWELCRVYVHPGQHGTGLAHRLMDCAEHHAVDAGTTHLMLWTDTRFERAHRFYEKRGYIRGDERALNDLSNSREYRYDRSL